jgi:hypothetical protein
MLSREQYQALERDIIALLQKEDDEYEAQINALKRKVFKLKRKRAELQDRLVPALWAKIAPRRWRNAEKGASK